MKNIAYLAALVFSFSSVAAEAATYKCKSRTTGMIYYRDSPCLTGDFTLSITNTAPTVVVVAPITVVTIPPTTTVPTTTTTTVPTTTTTTTTTVPTTTTTPTTTVIDPVTAVNVPSNTPSNVPSLPTTASTVIGKRISWRQIAMR